MVKPSERKSRNTQSSYKAEGRAADHDHDHTHDREEKKEKGGNVGSKRERQEEQEKAGSKGGEESMKDNQAPAAKATKREQNDKTVEELQPDKQEQARKESGGHFTVLEQGMYVWKARKRRERMTSNLYILSFPLQYLLLLSAKGAGSRSGRKGWQSSRVD